MGWGCQEPKVVKLYALLLNLAQVENNIKLWHKADPKAVSNQVLLCFLQPVGQGVFSGNQRQMALWPKLHSQ